MVFVFLFCFALFFSFTYNKINFCLQEAFWLSLSGRKKLAGIKANSLWIWQDDKHKNFSSICSRILHYEKHE